jgi:hypothetical protein
LFDCRVHRIADCACAGVQGQGELQLLHNITGSFRPGVLTALMGVSGERGLDSCKAAHMCSCSLYKLLPQGVDLITFHLITFKERYHRYALVRRAKFQRECPTVGLVQGQ